MVLQEQVEHQAQMALQEQVEHQEQAVLQERAGHQAPQVRMVVRELVVHQVRVGRLELLERVVLLE